MYNSFGVYGAISFITIIESALRILTYLAVISVSFKGIQALNVYINKNSR